MKKKALLIGALPLPLEGPWVRLNDGKSWAISTKQDVRGQVILEINFGDGDLRRVPLYNRGRAEIIGGAQAARCLIPKEIKDCDPIFVIAEQIR